MNEKFFKRAGYQPCRKKRMRAIQIGLDAVYSDYEAEDELNRWKANCWKCPYLVRTAVFSSLGDAIVETFYCANPKSPDFARIVVTKVFYALECPHAQAPVKPKRERSTYGQLFPPDEAPKKPRKSPEKAPKKG